MIFAIFTAVTGALFYHVLSSTKELSNLIDLHEIEDIRQDLAANLKSIQLYTYAPSQVFADNLDAIIKGTEKIDQSLASCQNCHHHHRPSVRAEIESVEKLISALKQELSYLITTVSGGERRQAKQEEVSRINSMINDRVSAMVHRAGMEIKNTTIEVMAGIHDSFFYLIITIVVTFILAFFIAMYLTISLVKPIDNLVNAAREIATGNWGYQSDFKASDEFAVLINTFNTMSSSLEAKREQILEQFERLKSTQNQLVEAEKFAAIGTLVGGIAHDFNNILCGITGHISLLKKKFPDAGPVLDSLTTVESAGIRAADLVGQLLTFSSQKVVEPQIINVNECVASVVELLRSTFSKKITLETNLASPPPLAHGDPGKIEQVVMNLCINARDAMPEGGAIHISTKSRYLDQQFLQHHDHAAIEPGEYVQLVVSDTGTGIDDSIKSRIFEPFFTTKDVGKGTGLGLAMVYGIVKGHGGYCTVASIPGKGTSFNVYLPQSTPTELNPAKISSQREIPAGKSILIVDDEKIVTSMLEEHLRDLGCTTFSANDGEKGVAVFKEHRDRIDLVILDLNMPVMDGFAAFDKIIAIRPDIKVLICSGYSEGDRARRLLRKGGASGFIQKPFQFKDIDDKISEILLQQ